MSHVDELIVEHCPAGVRHLPLSTPEVASYATGAQLNRAILTSEGEHDVFNGGVAASGRHSSYNTLGPAIIVSQGGASAGYVNYVREPFWAGAHCYVVTPGTAVERRYLFHVLKSKQAEIQSSATGAGIPGLSRAALGAARVPVPPMEVQQEIVRILDTFTELEAELEAELESRRAQYSYYSETLLSAGTDSRATRYRFGDVLINVIDHRGKTPKKLGGDWTESGHRVVSAINVKDGRVDDNDHHYISPAVYSRWMATPLEVGDVLLTSEAPLGSVAFIDRPVDWAVGQRIFGLRPDRSVLDGRYLFHMLRAGGVRAELLSRATGSTVSGIRQSELVQIEVHLPPVEVQVQVAEKLDTFGTLAGDLSVGLPAELAARRKQYEYYRDRLLTFEELDA